VHLLLATSATIDAAAGWPSWRGPVRRAHRRECGVALAVLVSAAEWDWPARSFLPASHDRLLKRASGDHAQGRLSVNGQEWRA
jgi:hypothetical protein